ncbi:MAG: CBS domain-containing protein [Pseudomonadota bacterium]
MPSSYQAPNRRDAMRGKTFSQSTATNLAKDNSTVQTLLDGKGGDVYSIGPRETLAQAVTVLSEKRIGALLVTDANGMLQGILSERDIVRKLAATPGQTLPQTVEENMTREVVTCAPNDTLVSVLQKMTKGRFRHMPVVRDEQLCGMVTIGDVVNHRLRELEHEALQLKQMVVG